MHATQAPPASAVSATPVNDIAPLKLAIVGSRGYPSTYGGFETFVREIAPWLARKGHDTTVYTRYKGPEAARCWKRDEVRCRWTPGRDKKAVSTVTFGATGILDAATRSYDVVLALNIALGPFIPALRAAGTPVALNVDGLEWLRGKWGPAAKRAFRFGAWSAARSASRLVVDSRALADVWLRRYGVETTFIPYGAHVLQARPDLPSGSGLEPDAYVLVVSRITPENNVGLTLDAMERLRWPVPVVVAGTANYAEPVQLRINRLHQAGRVRWLGHVDDQELLAALWANCAVYVHGHSVGGTNPALLQALGAGAPTVALETPFNREVLEAQEQLYRPDAAALAALIGRYLGDPGLRERAGVVGKRLVGMRYRWDDVCRSYLDLLVGLAAARRQA
jgi:glycosyltransferase involved in cell wall biosynthesis